MIGFTTVGVKDLEKAGVFYDAVLAELGAERAMDIENFLIWGTSPDKTYFSICLPHDGEAPSVGNGSMIAFLADSPEQVQKIYDIALERGGTCEGEPGPRGDDGFYAGYFRDLDGNKLNAYCYT